MSNPTIIAHRGKHDLAPENSAAAILAALEIGVAAVEIDVRLTGDNIVVVYHDAVVPHNSEGRLSQRFRVSELTATRLAHLRLQDGAAIPTLDEVLRLAAGRCHVHVEIKARHMESEVLDCITRSGCEASVHSFDHRVIVRCAELNPEIPRGILLDSYLVHTGLAMRDTSAQDVWQQFELIDADLVRTVHDEGGRVVAWTVNDPGTAVTLAGMGVDALCTDDVPGIREALAAA